MRKYTILITFCFSFIFPWHVFGFFCPTNFTQINYGDTMEKVIEQCGKPDDQKEYVRKNENIPQEWTYFIPQAVSVGPTSSYQTRGTLKATFDFDAKGNVINMTVNGIGVGATAICGGKPVYLGSTRDQIKQACGTANFITKQTPAEPTTEDDVKVVEFNYKSTPPATLVFENGVLTQRLN